MDAKVKTDFFDKADGMKHYKKGSAWTGSKKRFDEINAKQILLVEAEEPKAAAKTEAKERKTAEETKERKTNTETK